jgi:hypothetical protein
LPACELQQTAEQVELLAREVLSKNSVAPSELERRPWTGQPLVAFRLSADGVGEPSFWISKLANANDEAPAWVATRRDWLGEATFVEILSNHLGPGIWEALLKVNDALDLGGDRDKLKALLHAAQLRVRERSHS